MTSWTEAEAGTLGAVSSIVQDKDGYLWVGTSAGLFRFDGARFTPSSALTDAPLPSSPVSALHIARDGSLLVGLANRAGVARINGRRLELIAAGPMRVVTTIVEDHAGIIWAVSEPSLYRLRNSTWQLVPVRVPGEPDGSTGARVVNAGVTRDGMLWVGSSTGLFVRVHDAGDDFTKAADDWVWSRSETASGKVWLTDTVKGFRRQDESTSPQDTVEGNGYRLLHDRYGFLWVATIGEGLWRVRTDARPARIEKATLHNGVFSDAVEALFEDREGNLWVGTTVGLHRLTPQKMTPLTNVGLVTSAEASASELLVGTNYGVLRFTSRDGVWAGQRLHGPAAYVNMMHRDRKGTVWVGAVEGLREIVGDEMRPIASAAALGLTSVTCVSSDSRGGLWLGDGTRVVRQERGRLTPLALPTDAPDQRVVCVYSDTRDRLWVGAPNARLSLRRADGSFQHFGVETFGPDANTIHGVFENSDGAIWVATNVGVTRFTDRSIDSFRRSHGLPSDRVWSVAEDDERQVWLSLDVGVIRVAPAEFERAANDPTYRIRYDLFDTSDGLAGAPILRVRSGRAPDGTLWFLRGGALTIGNTAALRQLPRPDAGSVRIEGVVTDERTFDAALPTDLRAGTKHIEIDYTAIALTQPGRVRFRYKVEGFDNDWIVAGGRRTAVYTNLPPRNYRFMVDTGTDRDGWRNAPAIWAFSVQPAFYQTPWFYGLAIAAIGVIIWATWRFRIRIMHREYAAVLAERTRLSREIHDTLLQGVVGVALQLGHITHMVGEASADAKDALVRTRHQVETYIREARRSIRDLRSPLLEAKSLPEVLADLGRNITSGMPVTFTLSVGGQVRRCSPRLENELLRIGQEAITNAIRHAHARSIRLELLYAGETVSLTVVDDGCGIADSRADQDPGDVHYGLIVMKERAENLGGRLNVAALPEGGTKIEAVLPAPIAA